MERSPSTHPKEPAPLTQPRAEVRTGAAARNPHHTISAALAAGFAAALAATPADACPKHDAPPCPQTATSAPSSTTNYNTYVFVTPAAPLEPPKKPTLRNYLEFGGSGLATWTPDGALGVAGKLHLKLGIPLNRWSTVDLSVAGEYGVTQVSPPPPPGFTVDEPVSQKTWAIVPELELHFGNEKVYGGISAGPKMGWTTTDPFNISQTDDPNTRTVENATGTIGEKNKNGWVDLTVGADLGVNLTPKLVLELQGAYDVAGPYKGAKNLGLGLGYRFGL